MLDPLIKPALRTLGLKNIAFDLSLDEKIPTLYGRPAIYSHPDRTIIEFRQEARFSEFIQQWRTLAEKVKIWMAQQAGKH